MSDSLDFISRTNPDYVDRLYQQYKQDPASVDERWALVFSGYEFGLGIKRKGGSDRPKNPPGVANLIHSYRELGHLVADVDPLTPGTKSHPLLEAPVAKFKPETLDHAIDASAFRSLGRAPLRTLIEALKDTYCRSIGVEFTHLFSKEQRDWLLERMEPTRNRPALEVRERKLILKQLLFAAGFEQFLQTHYPGSKRFSLEGSLSLIPLLNTLVEESVSWGAEEFVFGMPHRGRLNVLAHLLHKPYELILAEFEGLQQEEDVKYHLGYAHRLETQTGQNIQLSLSPNPSHLEAINPVVLGMVRAKQDLREDVKKEKVIPVLMHGDAAFAGQGVVYETLELSGLEGFSTGGTLHILINNQVGFTTSPQEARSTPYASDLAKILQAPIFHVNADDPEAVVWAGRLAIGFRQRFKTDVFIELIGYRRYGHNELDDPTFTQPLMYARIKDHPPESKIYERRLVRDQVLQPIEAERMQQESQEELQRCLALARSGQLPALKENGSAWQGSKPPAANGSAHTAVEVQRLKAVADAVCRFPETFMPHPRIPKLFEQMRALIHDGRGLHWAAGETLAYGSLLLDGIPVRLTGQDSARGTFSHRHAVLYDAASGGPYVPLNHMAADQARLDVINSPLNEAGVMGFEYGYACADPKRLVLWEAQFGDFSNAAQVIIDQFIASGEAKWSRPCGLVLLLPHGYEGQGPEHSSARLERFLQLCAEGNLRVINPTTPAQFFHALRAQAQQTLKKPLIVMTPKSLLRHKAAVSELTEFSQGAFQPVLRDPLRQRAHGTRRIALCSGKVFYTLDEARQKQGVEEVALIRLEQLYPFPTVQLQAALEEYPQHAQIVWVQEEPQNQGAWTFVRTQLARLLGREVPYIGRRESASPATGSLKVHQLEEEKIMAEALSLPSVASGATRKPRAKQKSSA